LVFRGICKELGADVMVTEFVSAEGILQADGRTRKYTEFTDDQRPVGVQLFGGDGVRLGEAAKKIVDWKRPDFIDLNYGCPVNKVVARNGGSSLLKSCGLVAAVAAGVVKAVGSEVPVTAKIRIGWDSGSIKAVEVARTRGDWGVRSIPVHEGARSQQSGGGRGAGGGNGGWACGGEVGGCKLEPAVAGGMIGGAAMGNPWGFREAREFLSTGVSRPATLVERWDLVLRHCRVAVASGRYGDERQTLTSMRSRLMAYCKGFPGARDLRQRLCHVTTVAEVEAMAAATDLYHGCLCEPAQLPAHE